MQYGKCQDCINHGKPCQFVMAQAMNTLYDLVELVNYSQTRQTNARCNLKIDYTCENFKDRKMEGKDE